MIKYLTGFAEDCQRCGGEERLPLLNIREGRVKLSEATHTPTWPTSSKTVRSDVL